METEDWTAGLGGRDLEGVGGEGEKWLGIKESKWGTREKYFKSGGISSGSAIQDHRRGVPGGGEALALAAPL